MLSHASNVLYQPIILAHEAFILPSSYYVCSYPLTIAYHLLSSSNLACTPQLPTYTTRAHTATQLHLGLPSFPFYPILTHPIYQLTHLQLRLQLQLSFHALTHGPWMQCKVSIRIRRRKTPSPSPSPLSNHNLKPTPFGQ